MSLCLLVSKRYERYPKGIFLDFISLHRYVGTISRYTDLILIALRVILGRGQKCMPRGSKVHAKIVPTILGIEQAKSEKEGLIK